MYVWRTPSAYIDPAFVEIFEMTHGNRQWLNRAIHPALILAAHLARISHTSRLAVVGG